MIRLCFLLFLIYCGARCLAAEPELVAGLPPLKDPTVLRFDGDTTQTTHLFIAMERSQLRGWWMEGKEAVATVEVQLPELEPRYVRWGPALLRHEGKICLYSGRGIAHDWPTFRLAVAVADEERDLVWNNGRLESIRFTEEHALDLHPAGRFRGTDRFGLIDPEVVAINGTLYIYYTGVLDGMEGVRWHESFIHSQVLKSPIEPLNPADDRLVYAGRADAEDGSPDSLDDGVAEAPTLVPLQGGYMMMFSSRPSDHHQQIAAVHSLEPHGEDWQLRHVLHRGAQERSFEEMGVGGQTVVDIDGVKYILYQGLGTLSGRGNPRFRMALVPLTLQLFDKP